MKHLLYTLVFAAMALAPAAGAASLTGKWQVHVSIAGNESDAACSLTQNGGELSGSCSAEQGAAQLSGTVDGNKVTWSYKIDYNGSPLTLKYAGALDGGKITGAVTVEEFGVEGEFTATQAK